MIDIRHNESLPLTPDIIKGASTSLEGNLLYHKYVNLAYDCINTRDRFIELSRNIENGINKIPPSILQMNLLIESNLIALLTCNTIQSPDSREISSHYNRRAELVPGHKALPTIDHVDLLGFGGIRCWGTEYGTLGYFMHLLSNVDSYVTPSQIEDICSTYIASLNPDIGKDILAIREDTSESADIDLYYQSISPITNTEVYSMYTKLKFMESWIPKVITWYVGDYVRSGATDPPTGDRYSTSLSEICVELLGMGLDPTNVGSLAYDYVHQSRSPNIESIYRSVIGYRRNSPSTDGGDGAEGLITELQQNIGVNEDEDLYSSTSRYILEYIAPPGGYNLHLVSIAAGLLNRAYIISHPTRLSISSVAFDSMTREMSYMASPYLNRLFRLIYLAGYTLKKSNLLHIRIIGGNLIALSKQTLPNREDSKDLLV